MKPHSLSLDLLPVLHRLNQDHVLELSSLNLAEFTSVTERASYFRSVGGDGLLLAFDQNADYDSVNFLWFRERYQRFVYVDRIVVAEFNCEPLNEVSEAFHSKMGFEPVGEAVLEGRGKSVRYVVRALAPAEDCA